MFPTGGAISGMGRALVWSLVAAGMMTGAGRGQTPAFSDGDWPMWRHDAAHTGTTPRALADRLALQWTRELPPLRPGWPDQPRVQMDAVYEPVAMGQLLFVPSARTDGVTAFDTRTGEEKWTFFTDGPVRFAPAAWDNRVYLTSDDGCLYCLKAETGSLLWKFRGGPSDRRILGNERLISTWPARGAPVLADGIVYFASGIWPFMGIFMHALDARTGAVVWTNEGDGALYMKQPHNVDAFAGVAPQGPMTVTGEWLLVSGGRSVPACYERATGKLKYFKFADNGRRGGSDVATSGGLFFAGGLAYDLSTGLYVGEFSRPLALSDDLLVYTGKAKDLLLARPPTMSVTETLDRKGARILKNQWKMGPPELVETAQVTCLLRAGRRLYAGSEGRITAFQLGSKTREIWRMPVRGTPESLIAADDRLFAVTREGLIHCLGAEPREPVTHPWRQERTEVRLPGNGFGVYEGYALLLGMRNPQLLRLLAASERLKTIAFSPDAGLVEQCRRELTAQGLYGDRVAVHAGDTASLSLPPYLASLIVCEDPELSKETLKRVYESVRPYGGRLWCKTAAGGDDLEKAVAEAGLVGARLIQDPEPSVARSFGFGAVRIDREGALPGAGNWTHEHCNAANTRVSTDSIVRAPLGLLWFGGPSHNPILPRHGHGPQPQVIDGRLMIEGVDLIRATDIYTGRILWETPLEGVGDFYNNVLHQPGANAAGSNMVTLSDGVYVAWKRSCVRLDPETGKILSTFPVPGGGTSIWTCVSAAGDYLVGGTEPTSDLAITRKTTGGFDDPANPLDAALKALTSLKADNDSRSASRRLFVMDRHSGRVLWQASARAGFRHNSICLGGGRLYVIDRQSGPEVERLKKKGDPHRISPALIAYDLGTGQELWRKEDGIFGTFLSYSEERDILVESGRVARDTINDEPKEMRAWGAAEGKPLWRKGYSGPGMIHGDTILMGEARACDLMTGAPRGRIHPITGLPVEWTWSRNYGCNTPAASEHLLTFRSGAAGYFDLAGDGGTGNLGGFKSGCTNNLIVAGGLLNAPDYTRTCICSYQNQASLALVPMPEGDMWTFFGTAEIKGAIKRIGVMFGAPGDRRAEDGTLWLEHPSVGGKSPAAPVALDGRVEYFRRHPSRIGGVGIPWVSASGIKGLSTLSLLLDKDAKAEQTYTVRLHFVEPDGLKPGERLFDVSLQGHEVLKDFDIVREAEGGDRALVKEFTVKAAKDLKLSFTPRRSVPLLCGLEVALGSHHFETPTVQNVLNSRLTVPETPPPPRPPGEERRPVVGDLPLQAILWITVGVLGFMLLWGRVPGFRRRPT